MDKFIAVIFPDEAKAYQALTELRGLHTEGSLTVFGTAVVQRKSDGTLAVKEQGDQGPLGFGMGSLMGALIGLVGGPVGATIGLAGGALVGSLGDYLHAGVGEDFVADIERELAPGRFAVFAEVSEDWIAPLNLKMEAVGGKVLREPRKEFIEAQLHARVDEYKANLERRKAERAKAKVERMEGWLNTEIANAQSDLQRTTAKAQKQLDHLKEELNAKIQALEEQAAKTRPEVRGQIEGRIAETRKQLGDREQMLRHAFEVAQQATH